MNAPLFTPGPWRFDEGMNAYGFQEEGAPILGTVRGAGDKPDGGEHIAVVVSDLAEAEANARLIAAAPELYAELQQFVNGVETRMIDSPANETLANITQRARAVLAKARGEQS